MITLLLVGVFVMGALSATEVAGLLTAAAALGATASGVYNAWRKRRDEEEAEAAAEDTVTITQAQGANLILDATVKALNTQVDRYAAEADRERARRIQAEDEASRLRRELQDCLRDRGA